VPTTHTHEHKHTTHRTLHTAQTHHTPYTAHRTSTLHTTHCTSHTAQVQLKQVLLSSPLPLPSSSFLSSSSPLVHSRTAAYYKTLYLHTRVPALLIGEPVEPCLGVKVVVRAVA
jgi:hypothetical protein